MHRIYGILFGTLFIVFIQASFLEQAISYPDDPQALFNAGTELYLQDDFSKATIFLERAKKCCLQKNEQDLNVKELAEKISLNLAHSLVKAEKYQEALAEYKDLHARFKNAKAEKNIPILEKFLQQQDQQDKQDQDKEQKQDSNNQADSSKQNQNNSDQENKQEQDNNQSDQSKNNFDKKNKQEKKQKLEQEQDQKEEKLEHQEQKDKQKGNDPDRKKNQEHPTNLPNDSINSKNQNKQKITNEQLLDKDELALLQAIENFDQDMMKMYAAANCGGDEEDGW